MKLYAIRDKETGQVYSLDEFLDMFLFEVIETDFVRPYQSQSGKQIRIEPTKPCEFCSVSYWGEMETILGEWKTLEAGEWLFCPSCGRRLGDETVCD